MVGFDDAFILKDAARQWQVRRWAQQQMPVRFGACYETGPDLEDAGIGYRSQEGRREAFQVFGRGIVERCGKSRKLCRWR